MKGYIINIKYYMPQVYGTGCAFECYTALLLPRNTYAEMARQELGHVDSLHNMAVRMIEKEKALDQQVPPAMQAVWDWEHEQMIDRVARIKSLLSMA